MNKAQLFPSWINVHSGGKDKHLQKNLGLNVANSSKYGESNGLGEYMEDRDFDWRTAKFPGDGDSHRP